MFNNILVCVDGSDLAMDAVRSAASIARRCGSRALALNVFRFPQVDLTNYGVWGVAIDQDIIDSCAKECRDATEPPVCEAFASQNVPTRFVQEGGFEAEVDVILRVAEREKADLIVLGSRGLHGASELFLGSVSTGVLHHAHCPVLIVRGKNRPCGDRPYGNILLASDGSPCAQKAAAIAIDLSQKFQAPLTVLNAYEDLASAFPPGRGEKLIDLADVDVYAKQWLDYVAKPVRNLAAEKEVCCTFVQERGKPEETILRYAEEHRVDMIVIGSRGLRGYQRLLLGSTSNRVVHHAECPVMVVR